MTASEELRLIADQANGLIDPAQVVEYARDPETALHSKFEWDDTHAAEQYRIWQARKLIHLEFVVIKEAPTGKIELSFDVKSAADGQKVRGYVSLPSDRGAGGYRALSDVLADPELRDQMLRQARADMRIFKQKYQALKELAEVFAAMDEALKAG